MNPIYEIKLSTGESVLVDKEDYERFSKECWCRSNEGPRAYARNNSLGGNMHRIIMGLGKGDKRVVDHRNNNGLDNRRQNLRICDRAANNINCKTYAASGYKGVSKKRGRNGDYWYAVLAASRGLKAKFLGSFSTPEDAARAFDVAAIERHGEFAFLNFPQNTDA